MTSDNRPLNVPVAGETIGGKYRVDGTIATGGMGIVLRATHLHLREPVAIKILRPDTQLRPESVARFMREARMTMKLRGRHAVRVFDVDILDGRLPYIVMELLEGDDLAVQIAARGRIPPDTTLDWLIQLCEGVAEAHAIGIVHRDLKPANVFVARGNVIKVLDFGVSKASSALLEDAAATTTASSSEPRIPVAVATTADEEVDLTSTRTTLGSPRYMSPEQMRCARDADERSDIWAIGAIAHEMLSGDPPFGDTDLEALRIAITRERPKSLAAPEELRAIVERCLAKEPAERWHDVTELGVALRRCAGGERRWVPRAAIGVAIAAVVALVSWRSARSQPSAPHVVDPPVVLAMPAEPTASAPVVTPPPAATPEPTQSSPRVRTLVRSRPAPARSADEHVFDNPE